MSLARKLLAPALLAALLSPAAAEEPARKPPGILDFYATARAAAASPVDEKALVVLCQEAPAAEARKGYESLWISFIGTAPSRVLLFAFTKERFASPSEVVTLRPRYNPMPTARFSKSATLDWGYVYDRDADGRVDYVAYLQNAHAVLPDPLPEGFPTARPGPDGTVKNVSKELLYAVLDSAQMVFRHYADDDRDGKFDAMVIEEFDPDRPMFVKDWVVYRPSKPGGPIDEAWAFRGDIRERRGVVERGPDGYLLPAEATGEKRTPVEGQLAAASRWLQVVNHALERCRARNPVLDLRGR
jgi:hypothetical protein